MKIWRNWKKNLKKTKKENEHLEILIDQEMSKEAFEQGEGVKEDPENNRKNNNKAKNM